MPKKMVLYTSLSFLNPYQPDGGTLIGGAPRVAHPAVDAAAAGEHPQDVLKPKVLPQAGIQHLPAAQAQALCA